MSDQQQARYTLEVYDRDVKLCAKIPCASFEEAIEEADRWVTTAFLIGVRNSDGITIANTVGVQEGKWRWHRPPI